MLWTQKSNITTVKISSNYILKLYKRLTLQKCFDFAFISPEVLY